MLDEYFLAVLGLVFSDKVWIPVWHDENQYMRALNRENQSCIVPKFTGDTEILATSHQSVGLACFDRGRDAARVKVSLLPSRHRDQSAVMTWASVMLFPIQAGVS